MFALWCVFRSDCPDSFRYSDLTRLLPDGFLPCTDPYNIFTRYLSYHGRYVGFLMPKIQPLQDRRYVLTLQASASWDLGIWKLVLSMSESGRLPARQTRNVINVITR